MILKVMSHLAHHSCLQNYSTAIMCNFLRENRALQSYLDIKMVVESLINLIKLHKEDIVIVSNCLRTISMLRIMSLVMLLKITSLDHNDGYYMISRS